MDMSVPAATAEHSARRTDRRQHRREPQNGFAVLTEGLHNLHTPHDERVLVFTRLKKGKEPEIRLLGVWYEDERVYDSREHLPLWLSVARLIGKKGVNNFRWEEKRGYPSELIDHLADAETFVLQECFRDAIR